MLLERARQTPGEVAYRVKKRGTYQERTWLQLRDLVARCAMGLRDLGLTKGKTVALMGDPCEEYVICELAANSLGAITYGIYPTSSQKEMLYLLNDGQASVFVAQNHQYADPILPHVSALEHLEHIVVIDTKGMFTVDTEQVIFFQAVLTEGEHQLESQPKVFEQSIALVAPEDSLSIVYTSGTTGDPKGAVISHGKHLSACYTLVDKYPFLTKPGHRTVAYLPLCHIIGKELAITLPLLTHIVPHFCERIEDLENTIFETAPTVLITVPRYLQKFASRMLVGIQQATPLKRAFYHTAVNLGRKRTKALWNGKGAGFYAVCYLPFYAMVFRPMLNKIGFNKLELVICVGAPLPSELAALWQIYGVNLSDLYGQTETGGAAIAAQKGYFPKPGNVGTPPTGWEVRLADNKEIQVRGKDMFEGYWKQPELTREVVLEDGWLSTGDTGEWTDDGNLRIRDRVRDIMVTSGGKTLSPVHIENAIRSSKYINEAVVFGHERHYVTALIEIDLDTVSAWARQNGVTYTGFIDVCRNPAIIDLIKAEIEEANKDLARVEQVKDFRIIPKELDPWNDGEPITPTRKVKRDQMYARFKELIESMYSEASEKILVSSEIGDVLNNNTRVRDKRV